MTYGKIYNVPLFTKGLNIKKCAGSFDLPELYVILMLLLVKGKYIIDLTNHQSTELGTDIKNRYHNKKVEIFYF